MIFFQNVGAYVPEYIMITRKTILPYFPISSKQIV
jgi:hypothetical protein